MIEQLIERKAIGVFDEIVATHNARIARARRSKREHRESDKDVRHEPIHSVSQ